MTRESPGGSSGGTAGPADAQDEPKPAQAALVDDLASDLASDLLEPELTTGRGPGFGGLVAPEVPNAAAQEGFELLGDADGGATDRAGPFELVTRLPSGSPGAPEVFLAHRGSSLGFLGRAVLKRATTAEEGYSARRELLIAEVRALAQLSHPNLLSLVGAEEDEDGVWVALEYVDGTDLRRVNSDLRDRGEALPFELACFIAAEILRGLHHAHTARDTERRALDIFHGDMKPSHVTISRTGHVKVGGFGSVPSRGRPPVVLGGPIGDVAYLSPEELAGQPTDKRTDVYAVGVILFELLTGRPCFSSGTAQDALRRISTAQLPLDRLDRESVPHELGKIVHRAVEISPARRYPNADEMANALETWSIRSTLHASPWVLSAFFNQHGLYGPAVEEPEPNTPRPQQNPIAQAERAPDGEATLGEDGSPAGRPGTEVTEARPRPDLLERLAATPLEKVASIDRAPADSPWGDPSAPEKRSALADVLAPAHEDPAHSLLAGASESLTERRAMPPLSRDATVQAEAPRAEAPRAEAPRAEAPRVEAPRAEPARAEPPGADRDAAPERRPTERGVGLAGTDTFAIAPPTLIDRARPPPPVADPVAHTELPQPALRSGGSLTTPRRPPTDPAESGSHATAEKPPAEKSGERPAEKPSEKPKPAEVNASAERRAPPKAAPPPPLTDLPPSAPPLHAGTPARGLTSPFGVEPLRIGGSAARSFTPPAGVKAPDVPKAARVGGSAAAVEPPKPTAGASPPPPAVKSGPPKVIAREGELATDPERPVAPSSPPPAKASAQNQRIAIDIIPENIHRARPPAPDAPPPPNPKDPRGATIQAGPPAGMPKPAEPARPRKGELEEKPATAVLSELLAERATGIVEFRSGHIWKKITLIDGAPATVSSNVGMEGVGEQLVRAKLISREDLDRTMRESGRSDETLLDRIVKRGLIPEAELGKQLGTALAARLQEVLAWQKGSFEFNPGSPEPPKVFPVIDLPALMEAHKAKSGKKKASQEAPAREDSATAPEGSKPSLSEALEMAKKVAKSAAKGRVDDIAAGDRSKRKR